MKAELIAHFFYTTPPQRTTRPEILCNPTNVASANCQALSPVSSHFGDGTGMSFSLAFGFLRRRPCRRRSRTRSKDTLRPATPGTSPLPSKNYARLDPNVADGDFPAGALIGLIFSVAGDASDERSHGYVRNN
jgi:hypothetical protein